MSDLRSRVKQALRRRGLTLTEVCRRASPPAHKALASKLLTGRSRTRLTAPRTLAFVRSLAAALGPRGRHLITELAELTAERAPGGGADEQ